MDKISEERLNEVCPELARRVRRLSDKCEANGIHIRVSQGLRSWEQQDLLYAQGRTDAGKVVTNARGGQSAHNFGYAVDIVEDGRAALGRLGSWPADVLVSDVNMPEMGGLELIQAMRASGRNQPVVLITGMEFDDVIHAAAHGASACLRKPMSIDELVWAIECALACRLPLRGRRRGVQ